MSPLGKGTTTGGRVMESKRRNAQRRGGPDGWAYVRPEATWRPRPPAPQHPRLAMVAPAGAHPDVETAASRLIDAVLAFRTACAAHGADPDDPVVAKAMDEARELIAFCDRRHGTA